MSPVCESDRSSLSTGAEAGVVGARPRLSPIADDSCTSPHVLGLPLMYGGTQVLGELLRVLFEFVRVAGKAA